MPGLYSFSSALSGRPTHSGSVLTVKAADDMDVHVNLKGHFAIEGQFVCVDGQVNGGQVSGTSVSSFGDNFGE